MGLKSHSQRMVTLQAHVYAADAIGAHVRTDTRARRTPSAPECRPTHRLWKGTGVALCLRLQGAGPVPPPDGPLRESPSHALFSDKEDPTGPGGAGSRGCRLGKEGKQVLQQLSFTNVFNIYNVPGAVWGLNGEQDRYDSSKGDRLW